MKKTDNRYIVTLQMEQKWRNAAGKVFYRKKSTDTWGGDFTIEIPIIAKSAAGAFKLAKAEAETIAAEQLESERKNLSAYKRCWGYKRKGDRIEAVTMKIVGLNFICPVFRKLIKCY